MAVPQHQTGAGIEVDVSSALKKLTLVQRAFSPRELLLGIGQAQLAWVGANLRAAGTDEPWAHMAAGTIAVRPLRQSGHHFSSNYQRELQQSFVAPDVDETAGTVIIGTNLRYAKFHHFGTKPYKISPKKPGGKLRFNAGGGFVYARSVNHPGLPARPFLPRRSVARDIAVKLLQRMETRLQAQLDGAP